MTDTHLLDFQRTILHDVLEEDGLLILGRGLGLRRIVSAMLSMFMDPGSFVLLVNSTQAEDDALQNEIRTQNNKAEGIRTINNETLSDQRYAWRGIAWLVG